MLTSIYLAEYANRKSFFFKFLYINIINLAGMPSIIYGLLGLLVFVRFLGFDRSLLSGGLCLGLLTLPLVIIVSFEALKSVPSSLKQAAYALGVRKWRVVFGQCLPAAFPGILTGFILSVSRVLGETSPLIIIGAVSYITFVPESLKSVFTVLPLQIYNWATRPQEDFHGVAAATIIVLLILLFFMNSLAIYIRYKMQKHLLR